MSTAARRWTSLEILDWTIAHFRAHDVAQPRLDAEILLAHVLGTQRIMLYAHFDRPLSPEERDALRPLVRRRAQGEPVAYLTGHKEFWSLDLEVTPSVLIPRPDTEILVEACLKAVEHTPAPRVLDVGCGSGAVALAIASERRDATVHAVDQSAAACEVARRNAARLSLPVEVTRSDLLSACPAETTYHAIVANLPYIRSDDMATLPRDVRDFEPHEALDGGPDGLAPILRLIKACPKRLTSGGWLFLEADPEQMPPIENALRQGGFAEVERHSDLAGLLRVVGARYPGPTPHLDP